jgi:trimeric autotransporter adhesin
MKLFPFSALALLTITSSGQSLLADRPSGCVIAWGVNLLQEGIGLPPADYYSTGAVKIASHTLSDATAVAAGQSHALALRSDGTVVGWGGNFVGEALGYKLPSPRRTSGQVSIAGQALSNVIAIAADPWTGQSFSLALKRDGTVVAWGDNSFGQTSTPAGLSNVTAIAAGAFQGLAIKTDGTIANWGQGNPPPNWLTNVVAIAAGGESGQNLALRRDGTVAEWPVRSAEYVSTVPAGLSNVVAVATAGGARLALKGDGTVLGWGPNQYGQATGVPTPQSPHESCGTVIIGGQVLTNVAAIAAGFEYSVALKQDGTVVTWGHPLGMQIAPPAGLSGVVAIAPGVNFCLAITTNAAAFALKK